MFKMIVALALCLGVVFGAALGPVRADWPERPIRFIVPYSPGGGFDALARAVAPKMGEKLGTKVVVQNISGASGQRGASTVFRADPDGYTIGMFNLPGFSLAQLTGTASGYDLGEVTWIGSLSAEQYSVLVRADSEISNIAGLCDMGRAARVSSTGFGSTEYTVAVITMNALDCRHTMVTGYEGSTENVIAILRGDVDATFANRAVAEQYIATGDMKAIFSLTDTRIFDGVETSLEIGQDALHHIAQFRMVGAPPGLPGDIRDRLSEALISAATDPEVVAWAKGSGREIAPVGHEAASRINRTQLKLMAKFVEFFQ